MTPEQREANHAQNESDRKSGRIILGKLSQAELPAEIEPTQRVIREPFPDGRTNLWLPRRLHDAASQIADDQIRLIVTQDALRGIGHHVSIRTDRELGGFLLGNRYFCPNTEREYVIVDQFWGARYTQGDAISLEFTADSWAEFDDQLQTRFRGKLLVGWYHSHPGMAVFLSEDDLTIHKNRFGEPWQFALVLEPVTSQGGFFATRKQHLHPNDPIEFYEYFGHRVTNSVLAWTNYVSEREVAESPLTIYGEAPPEGGQVPTKVIPLQSASARKKLFGPTFLQPLGLAAMSLLIFALSFSAAKWRVVERALEKLSRPLNPQRQVLPVMSNQSPVLPALVDVPVDQCGLDTQPTHNSPLTVRHPKQTRRSKVENVKSKVSENDATKHKEIQRQENETPTSQTQVRSLNPQDRPAGSSAANQGSIRQEKE